MPHLEHMVRFSLRMPWCKWDKRAQQLPLLPHHRLVTFRHLPDLNLAPHLANLLFLVLLEYSNEKYESSERDQGRYFTSDGVGGGGARGAAMDGIEPVYSHCKISFRFGADLILNWFSAEF